MKLRIVSGSLKGRYLTIPERDADFRPTRERVREAVANILEPVIRDAVVADLCAGSGAFGFEMLSRGAGKCLFVEDNRFRVKLLRQHAERCGVASLCTIAQSDVRSSIRSCTERFDIIYFDPPYDEPLFVEMIPEQLKLLSQKGILVYERRNRRGTDRFLPTEGPVPFDCRRYGETEVRFYRNEAATGDGVGDPSPEVVAVEI